MFVDPTAKVVLERAAKVYGATPKWSAQIAGQSPGASFSRITVAFVRPKLLKIEDRFGPTTTLEMVDGKMFSSYLKDPEMGSHSKRVAQQRSVFQHMLMGGPTGMGELLALLLAGKSGLDNASVKELAQETASFTIKRLPGVPWQGRPCHRILFERRFTPSEEDYMASRMVKDEHWFTEDGKLVKTIAVSDGDTWKYEIVAQNFTPTFGPKTFVFSPPPPKPMKFTR